jgi:20S proteasome, alpha and beta subunits
MSLCIALNNPKNFVIIASDGRISKGGVIVRDDHRKLTLLTERISIFISGAQDYCEELRSMVEAQVNQQTSIEEVSLIVQKASVEVQERFEEDYPDYLEVMPGFGALATVVAYFDAANGVSGMIEYDVRDGFIPHYTTSSELKVRGVEREKVFAYMGSQFDPSNIIEGVFSTFKYISSQTDDVGGTITLHVISANGTDAYEWRDLG